MVGCSQPRCQPWAMGHLTVSFVGYPTACTHSVPPCSILSHSIPPHNTPHAKGTPPPTAPVAHLWVPSSGSPP